MKLVNLSFSSVFVQREYRESPLSETKRYQVLDHYEGVLEVELEGRRFTAGRFLHQPSVSLEEIKGTYRKLRKDISAQVEKHIFKAGIGALRVTHPDLIGFPTKYACNVTVEGESCEASFHVTEDFKVSAQEELLPRVEYQLKRQILNQVYAKLFEGWKIDAPGNYEL